MYLFTTFSAMGAGACMRLNGLGVVKRLIPCEQDPLLTEIPENPFLHAVRPVYGRADAWLQVSVSN
ncbi:hypothetical protein KKI24_08620 [bacterium]|nr:hypothetical protein [bacterium]